jgi:hypothetical protein
LSAIWYFGAVIEKSARRPAGRAIVFKKNRDDNEKLAPRLKRAGGRGRGGDFRHGE